MVEYLFLIFAIICIGGQFSLSKLYQVKVGNGAITSFSFSLISSFFAIIAFACVCKFNITFNWFSFLTAAGGTLCIALYTVVGMKMMSIGKVAIYTMILMMGGMFIPFLYGVIFLDEAISVYKVLGVVLLIVALIMPIWENRNEKNKNPKLFALLSAIVFFANGMVGVFNKMHQTSEKAISTYEFGFWQSVISFLALCVIVFLYYIFNKEKNETKEKLKLSLSKWLIILFFMIISQGGAIFQLFAAKTVAASVMFPIVTGGTMVASTIFGKIFFKEKIDKFLIFGLLFSIISTIFFIV